jgi:hypothetical protein
MTFHVAAILSGLAYLALCLLAAGSRLPAPYSLSPAQPEQGRKASQACLLALPAWLCIPPGTLPAFVPTGWSGAAALVCLLVATGFAEGRRLPRDFGFHAALRLCLALAACAWHAQRRGVPGDLLSLDAYVAMPLAGVTENAADATGLALLGLGSLRLTGDKPPDRAASLRHLAGLAIWICLFLPACPSRDLGLGDLAGFALDGLYFWGKILILDYASRLAIPCASPRTSAVQTGLAGAGAALLIFGRVA